VAPLKRVPQNEVGILITRFRTFGWLRTFPTDENISTLALRQNTISTGLRQILPETLLEFANLPGSCSDAVGDKPGESRITYIAEFMHGAPEFHRPWMFVFDERRESPGAPFKKGCTYLSEEASIPFRRSAGATARR
jgi:hypothetical protein